MIDIFCPCGMRTELPERAAGQPFLCPDCGGTVQAICAESIRDGAGVGDFDTALDVCGPAGSPTLRYLLGGIEDIQIGRSSDRQLVLSNQEISRQHCKLVRMDFGPSRWKIVDQNSGAGVFVNDLRVTGQELQIGDEIRIGTCGFTFAGDISELVELDGPSSGGSVCPSCEEAIGVNGKICVGCGIHVSSGRPLITQLALDENKLRASAYQWIRLASIFVRIMPLPMPIRSEVHSPRKPYAIWTLAAITVIASLAFCIDRFPGHDQLDFARPHNELLLWSPYQSNLEATSATLNPTTVRNLAAKMTSDDRNNLRVKYDPSGRLTDYQLTACLLLDILNANKGEFHWYQLFTHMFLHDTSSTLNFVLHLGGNLLFLLVLGTRVNSAIGNWVTAVAYLAMGVCAATVYLIFTGTSAHGPMLGASGAIMGLAGMYLILFPVHRVICAMWVRVPVLLFKMFAVRGFWVILIYFAFDVISQVIATYTGAHGGVAHAAHIGGFISGAAIALAVLASRQFTPGSGDLPSILFGKRVWPMLGRPSEVAVRRDTLLGSAIFAGSAACIIPFAGVVLACYRPSVDEHTPIAMTAGAGGSEPDAPSQAFVDPRAAAKREVASNSAPQYPPPVVLPQRSPADSAVRQMLAEPHHVHEFAAPSPNIALVPPPQIAAQAPPAVVPPQAGVHPLRAAVGPPPGADRTLPQRRFSLLHNVNKLPAGASETAMIGLDGGGPYLRVDPNRLPVIGFTIRIGEWDNHTTIGSAMPLFATPDDLQSQKGTVCLAKDGYVVGGIIVNSVDGADGLCVVFMKRIDHRVDPHSSYTSPWFGYTGDGTKTKLDGNGKIIIGTFGRQGMNMNKIGLIVDDAGKALPKK